MNVYQKELQRLRPSDEIYSYECNERTKGYYFIPTASHGYLVVPKEDRNAPLAKEICCYGYEGRLAYYLEEDCEAGQFLARCFKTCHYCGAEIKAEDCYLECTLKNDPAEPSYTVYVHSGCFFLAYNNTQTKEVHHED